MVDFTASARRLYRRLAQKTPSPTATALEPAPLHPEPELAFPGDPWPGEDAEADGASAVGVLEAWIGEAAGLGGSSPATAAGRRFEEEARREEINVFHEPAGAVHGAGGRGSLAAAIGLQAAGLRSTAFLSGPDLLASLDLLNEAVRRRLPLVVHLAARAGGRHVLGSGHEAYHAAAASGAALFFAADVQEAVDLTLVARRLAEDSLTPAVIAMDGPETALTVQDFLLPDGELLRRFLGRPGDTFHPPTPSQEMLFGKHRRRVPRWHDLDRPILAGAAQGGESYALGEAGRRTFFDVHLPALFDRAARAYADATGRHLRALRTHRVDEARLLLVVQGAAVETVEAVADHLRDAAKLKIGVVGVRSLRPFPGDELRELLRDLDGVAVLERSPASGLADPPLLGEIRQALAAEVDGGERPRLASVLYGLGGFPLRAADLVALGHKLLDDSESWPTTLYLGFDVATGGTDHPRRYPKRQALSDALRRSYFGADHLGLRSIGERPRLLPEGAFAVSVHRPAQAGTEPFAAEAAMLLRRLLGGHVRSRPGVVWARRGDERVDVLTHAAATLRDAGDDLPTDLAVYLPAEPAVAIHCERLRGALKRLGVGGALLLPGDAATLRNGLQAEFCRAVHDLDLKLYAVADLADDRDLLHREETFLGAFAAVLSAEKRAEITLRKLLQARRKMLEEHGDADAGSRLDALQKGFEGIAKVDVPAPAAARAVGTEDDVAPAAVRRLERPEAPLADLAEFWGRAGALYREGATADLTPDPFLATGTVPPRTAALAPPPPRATLPVFDPEACTGCGECWSVCPDGALEPAVFSAEGLIDLGMRRAKQNGRSTDALRMVSSKLAARMRQTMHKEFEGGPVGTLLESAFRTTLEKMKLPDERQKNVSEAFEAVRAELAELPVARTSVFFDEPEAAKKGDGELFTLAVDPDVCKGCGLCVAVCESGGLVATADGREAAASARKLRRLVAELPEAGEATIERARGHASVGPLAGALLSVAARQVMVGRHGGEAGSGEALALRQVLGAAAFHLAPRTRELVEEVRELQEKVSALIHDGLADALPDRDLDALARGLDAFQTPDVDLRELTGRLETAFTTDRVDVVRTRRLVATARELADLAWRLESGEAGLGRARFGVVLGTGTPTALAGVFPRNPFAVPVTVDATGDAGDLARGVAEGHARTTVAAVRTLRRAKAEVAKPGGLRPSEATEALAAIERLGYADLEPGERRFCPPVFVVLAEENVHDAGLAGLLGALASDLPIAAIVLADPKLADLAGESAAAGRPSLPELAKALPGIRIGRTSIADGDHLEASLAELLAGDGPAVLEVHAPSPERRGFAAHETLERAAREAVESGVFGVEAKSEAPAEAPVEAPPDEAPSVDEGVLAALRQEHAVEIDALRREHEARLAQQAQVLQAEMAQKIRGRLMQLALAGTAPAPPESPEAENQETPS